MVEYITAFMQDLQSKRIENLRKWFGPKSRLWMAPVPPVEGDSRILAIFRKIFARYTDLNWKVTQVYPIDKRKFIYETDSWGAMAEGQPYKNNILTIIEFDESGKIIWLSDYFKSTAMFGS